MLGSAYSGEDQKIVTGGIEKFSKQLTDLFASVSPIYITKDDKKHRRTKHIIRDAVENAAPDIILINEPWTYTHVRRFNVPIISIFHEPLDRDIRMVNLGNIFKQMIEDNVHIYFVSRNQFAFHKESAKRIQNVDITEGDIMGFVSSSYCKNLKFSENLEYDCATIGRTDLLKRPFRLHEFAKGSGLTTLVMTNEQTYKSEAQNNYVRKNADWAHPQITERQLEHAEVIERLSKSKAFLSTCPAESWGITAMEALGCGVPVILLTKNDGDMHSSEDIATDPSHYRKIKIKDAKTGLAEVVEELSTISVSKRRKIYNSTNERHSEKNWKKQFEDVFSKRLKSHISGPKHGAPPGEQSMVTVRTVDYRIPGSNQITLSNELADEIRERFQIDRDNRFQLFLLAAGLRKKYLDEKTNQYADEFNDWFNTQELKGLFGSLANFTKYASAGDVVAYTAKNTSNPDKFLKQLPVSIGALYEISQILTDKDGKELFRRCLHFTTTRKSIDEPKHDWKDSGVPLIRADISEAKIRQWRKDWENPPQPKVRDSRRIPLLDIHIHGSIFNFNKKTGDRAETSRIDLPEVEEIVAEIRTLVAKLDPAAIKLEDNMDYITEHYIKRRDEADPARNLLPAKKSKKAKTK